MAAQSSSASSTLLYVDEAIGKNRPYMKAKHYHEAFEIYFFKGREVNYFIEDKTYSLKKNDCIIIDRYILHKTYSQDEHYQRFLIHCHPDYLKEIPNSIHLFDLFQKKSRQNNLISPCPSELIEIEDICTRLKNHCLKNPIHAELYKRSLLVQLLVILDEAWERNTQSLAREFPVEQNKRVQDILRYINLNYWEDLSLDHLARRFYINKYHLCHIFKKYTDFTLIEYINKKRIAEAEYLLTHTNLKVTDIAYKTGFNSLTQFNRVFKQVTRASPREFRQS